MERESTLKQVWGSLTQNKGAMAGLVIIVILAIIAVIGDAIAPYDPELSDMTACFVAPCAEHIFGTDQLGRDIFSRVLSGTKVSLTVGLLAVSISLTIGTVVGAIAGYCGGKVDMVIMRIMDMMLAVPWLHWGKGLIKRLLQLVLYRFRNMPVSYEVLYYR